LIMPMKLGNDLAAFMTICFLKATSYRNDKVTSLRGFHCINLDLCNA